MKIAFTLCSNNYLPQAKTLGDSLMKYNPDYRFVIGLVDKLSPQINYSKDIVHEIIPIEDIGIPDFDGLWKIFNIIELNTCVKPSIIRYFFNKNPDLEFILFFDPDIMVFDTFSEIESKFGESDFILTPHVYAPFSISEKRPNESDFLNYGIYNLGFLGLKNSTKIKNDFLPWWEERTLKLGFIKPDNGLFVDQIWFNLVPLFFKKTYVLDNMGCNVAPWNLHERDLIKLDDKIIVNGKDNLIFYHFSSFRFRKPDTLFYNYDRNLNYITPAVEYLYSVYLKLLIENKVEEYSAINCSYVEYFEKYKDDLSAKRRLKKRLKGVIPVSIFKLIKRALNR